MKRWLLWFGLGAVIAIGTALAMESRDRDWQSLATVGSALFFLWAFITSWAVPIAIIWWLVSGRRHRARHVS